MFQLKKGKNESWARPVIIAGIIVLVLMAAVLTIIAMTGPTENSGILLEGAVDYPSAWYLEDGRAVSEAGTLEDADSDVILQSRLPEDIQSRMVMAFRNNYQRVRVWVDDELVYEYGMTDPVFGKLLGNVSCKLGVMPESAGKVIRIQLQNPYNSGSVTIPEIFYGTEGRMSYTMLSHNFEIIFFVTFIILLTLVLGILGIIQWIKKFWTAARLFLEMMLFLLLCGGWVLTDSLVPMVFTNNSILVCVSSFYMFMLMPIPMVLFVQDLCGRKSRIGRELIMGFLILAAVCSVSYVAGGPDFLVLMPVVHLLLAVTVIWLLMYLLREYRATRSYYAGGMLLAITALGIFGVVGIVEYYSGSANSWDASRMFCCGFIAFVVVLAVLVAKQSLEKVRIETESRAYQKMAYIDALTQMGNRLSFEEQCAQLNGEKLRKITAAILDVNGMKQVNDIYGHSAGDEMMQTVAAAIREVFGRKGGECFRIGGDEFAVILHGDFDEDIMSELLKQKIDELVKDAAYDITVAVGFARAADYPELAVKEIFKVADTRMYKNKSLWYIANGK